MHHSDHCPTPSSPSFKKTIPHATYTTPHDHTYDTTSSSSYSQTEVSNPTTPHIFATVVGIGMARYRKDEILRKHHITEFSRIS